MPLPFTAPTAVRDRWGEWFSQALKDTGLSQERFAASIGRTRQQVIRWKNGEALPDPEVLSDVARVLGKSLAETYRMAGQSVPTLDVNEPDEWFADEMRRIVDRAPAEKKPRIRELLRRQAEDLVSVA